MKELPLVSVIIPTYNSSRTLRKCLETIKSQDYPNVECIVVDNHSTDNTLEIAHELADLVFTKEPERSAQRNYGVSKAKGEYVLVHDSDIYFPDNIISECMEVILAGNYDALILPEQSIGEGYWAKVKAFERSFYVGNDDIEAVRFFRKAVYEKLGGYDEELTGPEDWDLTVRLRKNGNTIGRTKTFLLHDEGKVVLWGSSKKKKYYAKDMFEKYAHKHPEAFARQMNIGYRFPLNLVIKNLIFHPILFVSMILMKGLEYINSIH